LPLVCEGAQFRRANATTKHANHTKQHENEGQNAEPTSFASWLILAAEIT
jgi:hypothetical protein